MKFKAFAILSIVAVVALTLTSCGRERAESTPTPVEAFVTATPVPTATSAAPAGDAENGKVLFATACSACHGPAGEGVPGLGKDMTTSEFIAGLSDAELLDFVKVGRAPTDPLNTTGVLMPPRGGNPALNDDAITDIIAFIRTLHK